MELAKLDWRDLFSAKEELSPESIAVFDDYFSHFVAIPIEDGKDGKKETRDQTCPGCGKAITGFFGTFTWGIVHGHGMCANCGWPVIGFHYINDKSGKRLLTLTNVILIVHPDFVSKRGKDEPKSST